MRFLMRVGTGLCALFSDLENGKIECEGSDPDSRTRKTIPALDWSRRGMVFNVNTVDLVDTITKRTEWRDVSIVSSTSAITEARSMGEHKEGATARGRALETLKAMYPSEIPGGLRNPQIIEAVRKEMAVRYGYATGTPSDSTIQKAIADYRADRA